MNNKKDRNKLCSCGSGLKYKNCCFNGKKEITRHIPQFIQREVIQKFGPFCIFCGLPLFELHHINPYSELIKNGINPHTANNIVPLCPSHHTLIHNDKISLEELESQKEEIIKQPDVKSSLFTKLVPPIVFLGDAKIEGTKNIFVSATSGEVVFSVEELDGNLLLNLCFKDENNKNVLVIKNNEWIVNKDNLWTLEVEMGKNEKFKLIEECAKIIISTKDKRLKEYAGLEVELIKNVGIKILNAKFYCFGKLLEVFEDGHVVIDKRISMKNVIISNWGGAFCF